MQLTALQEFYVDKVTPINTMVLIEPDQMVEEKIGSIIVPDTAKNSERTLCGGTVVAIPREFENGLLSRAFEPGDKVRFTSNSAIPCDLEGSRVLVHSRDILLVSSQRKETKDESLFDGLDDWAQFAGMDEKDWSNFSNIRAFSFQVHFLDSFQSLRDLAKRTYEIVAQVISNDTDVKPRQLKFSDENGKYRISLLDDFWQFSINISEEDNAIAFNVQRTNIQRLHATLPIQMRCVFQLLTCREFLNISGEDYNRVTIGSFHIDQKIRILGRGSSKKSARNSLAMQRFLHFADGKKIAALDALGVESDDFGRIDLNIGFDRLVGDQKVTIFLKVEAPANEEYSTLEVQWNLQYIEPGNSLIQNYSPVLSHFLKDLVFRTFYQKWLRDDDLDLQCETDRS